MLLTISRIASVVCMLVLLLSCAGGEIQECSLSMRIVFKLFHSEIMERSSRFLLIYCAMLPL